MTAQAVLADRDPSQALHNGKPPFKPNASKMAGLRGRKASELDHFGRARQPKAAAPIAEWIGGDRGCLLYTPFTSQPENPWG